MPIAISWRESSLTCFGTFKSASYHTHSHIFPIILQEFMCLCDPQRWNRSSRRRTLSSLSPCWCCSPQSTCSLAPSSCSAMFWLSDESNNNYICTTSASLWAVESTHSSALFDYWLREPTKVFVSRYHFFFFWKLTFVSHTHILIFITTKAE